MLNNHSLGLSQSFSSLDKSIGPYLLFVALALFFKEVLALSIFLQNIVYGPTSTMAAFGGLFSYCNARSVLVFELVQWKMFYFYKFILFKTHS